MSRWVSDGIRFAIEREVNNVGEELTIGRRPHQSMRSVMKKHATRPITLDMIVKLNACAPSPSAV